MKMDKTVIAGKVSNFLEAKFIRVINFRPKSFIKFIVSRICFFTILLYPLLPTTKLSKNNAAATEMMTGPSDRP